MKLVHLSSNEFKSAVSKLVGTALPPKTAFQIKKLVQNLESELAIFEEMRKNLIEEYATRDENGEIKVAENGNIFLDPTRTTEWQSKFSDLSMLETSLPLPAISLTELGDKVELSASDLIALDSIVVE